MSTDARSLHDQLLALKPAEASHDESACKWCSGTDVEIASQNPAGGLVADPKTYTEDEFNAVAGQVSALEAKVAELSSAVEADEVAAKIAEARAEVEAQVAELQTALDAKTLEAETAKAAHDEIVNFLDKAKTDAEEAAEFEALKTDRTAAVKEAAPLLPDEYISENAERFAKMDEEAFTASLEGFKAIAAKAPATKTEIPATTAMTAARSNDGESNPLRDVLSLRAQGVDTRTIN